jgi:hypothetical protein
MGVIVKVLLAVLLFAGSLVGGLAATGRLNHEGTANIPLLRSFFPASPEPPAGDAGTDPKSEAGKPVDAAHAAPGGETKPADANAPHGASSPQGPQEPADASKPRKQKTGRSLVGPEGKDAAKADGHGGEADTEEGDKREPANAHGTEPATDAGKPTTDKPPAKPTSHPEQDFKGLEHALTNARSEYTPGELFRFQGLPAGLTPEQVNEAWQRVQGLLTDIERRKTALDLREQEVQELHEETGRRQAALAKERLDVEQMQRELDAKIAAFKEQVKLVRNDEVAALKRNAQTLASFEPEKAAQLIETQWKSDRGQDEVLKLLEFMEKDAVNALLAVLPPALTSEVMKKRMRVSREPAPSGRGN